MKSLIKKVAPKKAINFANEIRQLLEERVPNHEMYVEAVEGRIGLEIGGPSKIFKHKLPVYPNCSLLEFANFASQTIWEGQLGSSVNYYKDKMGKQHIAEASNLGIFRDNEFDFVISSNCLEHVANPIKALEEWKRVARSSIILIVPRKDYNFDRNRKITSFEHLIDDFRNDVDERDLTHLDEILHLHDLSLDPPAGSREQFRQRSLNNYDNRCLHHHVFDDRLMRQICDHLKMRIVEQSATASDWIFLLKFGR